MAHHRFYACVFVFLILFSTNINLKSFNEKKLRTIKNITQETRIQRKKKQEFIDTYTSTHESIGMLLLPL